MGANPTRLRTNSQCRVKVLVAGLTIEQKRQLLCLRLGKQSHGVQNFAFVN